MRDSSVMVAKSTPTHDITHLAAGGAGLAAALLCLVVRQGTLPAVMLAYLAPLPIMIATLGFGQLPGLGAAAIAAGTVVIYLVARPVDGWFAGLQSAGFFGGIFTLTQCLPAAWWLARLTRLRQDESGTIWHDSGRSAGEKSFATCYPLSRIVAYAVACAFAITTFSLAVLAIHDRGFDTLIDRWATKIVPYIGEVVGGRELPAGMDLRDLARFYSKLVPPAAASFLVLLLMANLWFGGRIVQMSSLLVRPWPDIAQDLRLPRILAPAFLVLFGLCLLNGLAGTIAGCAAAALGMGFVLEGLAVIHAATRQVRFRVALLAAIYASALLLPLMFMPLLILGLLDAGFMFRDRKKDAPPPKI
jgi:Predicted membrane protein (DUF2232)